MELSSDQLRELRNVATSLEGAADAFAESLDEALAAQKRGDDEEMRDALERVGVSSILLSATMAEMRKSIAKVDS